MDSYTDIQDIDSYTCTDYIAKNKKNKCFKIYSCMKSKFISIPHQVFSMCKKF